MKKKIIGFLTVATAVTLLAACGGGGSKTSSSDTKDGGADKVETAKFPKTQNTKAKALEGETLNVALPFDDQIQGVWSYALYEDAYDGTLLEIADDSLFLTDNEFKYTNGGLADVEFDREKNTATVTLRKDLKWSDGEALTADDVVFAYEVVAHKDYTGVRYDEKLQNIVGIEDYHAGKADTISGIKKVDDTTVEITYKELNPAIQYGSGLLSYAMPKHYLSDVPVKKLQESDKIRKNPVTTGPFYISNVKVGESVEYTKNPYYYGNKPQVDKIVATVVPTTTVVDELKNKKYDIALDMPTDTYDSYADIDGYTNLGREELYYSYIGFKLGKFDAAKGENVMDPNAKMGNVKVRQAMAYAVDSEQLGEKVYSGLRVFANSVIVPASGDVYDADLEGYKFDEAKAKSLLEEAGYKDTNDDGFVEDPDGKEFVVNFAAMAGGESSQTVADFMKQSWENIGIKVEYTTGRLIDFNSFYDKILGDTDDVDVYAAAWGVGTDPNPSESFGRKAQYNMMRYNSEKMDEVLGRIASADAFDEAKNKAAYKDFQALVKEEVPAFPLNYNYRIILVNDRVSYFDYDYHADTTNRWADVAVSEKDRK
ncbi:hypothetical protein BAU15_08380 [Enterococcus sp. JM4C]|uniref:oligopeptide ABC transporter substrate-binding protein n=1 Tax=Candidatus Enterococcus huntleyi TaxID=1857217 RepID=UPI00137B62FA|nr:oligopeptide ABC transporter substrate-binding protein [Enterococcus sp. JM4C]KAF1297912.1 hypothetical protein BAU15_08380 [Enterococcus sp. JM4C]